MPLLLSKAQLETTSLTPSTRMSCACASFPKITESMRQSRCPAQLRDTLLPKLIFGALRVKDAEVFLKERGL